MSKNAFVRRLCAIFCFVPVILLCATLGLAAEDSRQWYIGLIHVGLDHDPPSIPLLRRTLWSLGYKEGRSLRFDWRNQPDEDTAEATAREFVRNGADLIVAFEDQSVRAAQAATKEVPIVFLHVHDPVKAGYVKSLSHPGGNTTGFVSFPNLITKEIELLKEAVPGLKRVLLLADPSDPATPRELASVHRAAAALGIIPTVRGIETEADANQVFAAMKPSDVDAAMVVSPSLRQKFPKHLVELAVANGLPIPTHRKELVEAGALFSYWPDHSQVGEPAARYIDRILRGEKPSTLPVQEVSRISVIVNRRAARRLGLVLPLSLLILANEVVD